MQVDVNVELLRLDDLSRAAEARAGGKAFNCAVLKQAGFPVPDGIVLLADASDEAAARAADHEWFDRLPTDALFAVRSSGIGEDGPGHSFAGIHETFLDVPRRQLAAAIARCRQSARSERALAYRRANHLPLDAIRIGVLIQRMVHPVTSGVGFTVNPVSGNPDELVINAARGLGEALVSGVIDPDEYIVRKRDRQILLRRPGDDTAQAVLSDDEVVQLAAMLERVERHYGAAQDVEWCRDQEQFWIVQSRPVTTSAPAAAGGVEWTRANFAEIFPEVMSPQAVDAFVDLLNRAEHQAMGRLLAPESELGPLVKAFGGRLYFNLAQFRRVCRIGGFAPAAMLQSIGHAGDISPDDQIAKRAPIGEFVRVLPDLLRLVSRHLRVARMVRDQRARTLAYLEEVSPVDPKSLSDQQIWSGFERWMGDGPEAMQTVLVLAGVLAHELPVRRACDAVGFPYERLVYPQLAAGERSVSSQQAYDLVALSDAARREPAVVRFLTEAAPEQLANARTALAGTSFGHALERYLEAYGHRGLYESDWALPRYEEDPTPLLNAVRAHLVGGVTANDRDIRERQDREAREAWTAFERRLSAWQRLVLLPRVRRGIATIKRYYVWREQVRFDMVRVLAVVRRWHLTLADRFVERGWLDRRSDYFLLHRAEIGRVISARGRPDTLRSIAAARRAEVERYRSVRMPLLMREADLPRLLRTAAVSGVAASDAAVLTGFPVSIGQVEGEVVVIRDPADFGKMKRGAILVAPATDPSWTPLFTLAAGVIVEVGGVLSHASTIAREFGLPALANVKQATLRLKTGERIRLDAVQGRIEKLGIRN
jgi:pyruvate,water dikinase